MKIWPSSKYNPSTVQNIIPPDCFFSHSLPKKFPFMIHVVSTISTACQLFSPPSSLLLLALLTATNLTKLQDQQVNFQIYKTVWKLSVNSKLCGFLRASGYFFDRSNNNFNRNFLYFYNIYKFYKFFINLCWINTALSE